MKFQIDFLEENRAKISCMGKEEYGDLQILIEGMDEWMKSGITTRPKSWPDQFGIVNTTPVFQQCESDDSSLRITISPQFGLVRYLFFQYRDTDKIEVQFLNESHKAAKTSLSLVGYWKEVQE